MVCLKQYHTFKNESKINYGRAESPPNRPNKTRTDLAGKFEELTESYNAGSRNIEELFQELVNLSRSLNEEEQRHVRENMT